MKKILIIILVFTILLIQFPVILSGSDALAVSGGFLVWQDFEAVYYGDNYYNFELPPRFFPGDSKYLYLYTITEGSTEAFILPNDAVPVFICEKTGNQSDAVIIRPAVEEAISWDLEDGLWIITINDWTTGNIQVDVEGNIYSIPVFIEFPTYGFSTETNISGFINTFLYERGNREVFYYIIPDYVREEWGSTLPGLTNRNIEIVTDTSLGQDVITATWGHNRRFIKFVMNAPPTEFTQICIGITNNYLGNIYSYIHHSDWLNFADNSLLRNGIGFLDYNMIRSFSPDAFVFDTHDNITLTLAHVDGQHEYVQSAKKPSLGTDLLVQNFFVYDIKPGRYMFAITDDEHVIFTINNILVGYLYNESHFTSGNMTDLLGEPYDDHELDDFDLYVVWRSGSTGITNVPRLDLSIVWRSHIFREN